MVPKNLISNPIPDSGNKYFSKYSPKNIAPTPTNAEVMIFEICASLISVECDWLSVFDR